MSFSKQIDGFVFLFYPKAWSMPNMSIRHAHGGSEYSRNTYALDADGRCTREEHHVTRVSPTGRIRKPSKPTTRCEAKVTEDLKKQAIHEVLGIHDGHVPEFYKETVTFKTPNVVTKLSSEWYVRRYKNQYTKDVQRWVFYHNCLNKAGMLAGDTFYKGYFDFMMPYLDRPWACQVCGTAVPSGLQLVSKLTKANIRM